MTINFIFNKFKYHITVWGINNDKAFNPNVITKLRLFYTLYN
jgi:hypothetical protein